MTAMPRQSILAALLLAVPTVVCAHPGHGSTTPESLSHYALEPVHWLPVAGILAAGAVMLAVRYWKRSR